MLPSIFTVAAAALVGGSNSSNNANNHSASTGSLHGSSGKDHNNNSIAKRGGGLPGTAASTNELNFRDYKAPVYNEQLNAHNALTFKLVKTGRYLFLEIFFC